MRDYDIYVTEKDATKYRHRKQHQTDDKPRESLDCLRNIEVGQQVIVIVKHRGSNLHLYKHVVEYKYTKVKSAMYQQDRKQCATQRRFRKNWCIVKSDTPYRRLRTNHQLVIERIS